MHRAHAQRKQTHSPLRCVYASKLFPPTTKKHLPLELPTDQKNNIGHRVFFFFLSSFSHIPCDDKKCFVIDNKFPDVDRVEWSVWWQSCCLPCLLREKKFVFFFFLTHSYNTVGNCAGYHLLLSQ